MDALKKASIFLQSARTTGRDGQNQIWIDFKILNMPRVFNKNDTWYLLVDLFTGLEEEVQFWHCRILEICSTMDSAKGKLCWVFRPLERGCVAWHLKKRLLVGSRFHGNLFFFCCRFWWLKRNHLTENSHYPLHTQVLNPDYGEY